MWLHKHPPQLVHMELLKDAHLQDACSALGLHSLAACRLPQVELRTLAASTEAPHNLEDQGASAATRARAAGDLPAAEVSCLVWLSQG